MGDKFATPRLKQRLVVVGAFALILFVGACQQDSGSTLGESTSPASTVAQPSATSQETPKKAIATPSSTPIATATEPPAQSNPSLIDPLADIVAEPAPSYADIPYDLVSQDSLFSYLEDLTTIQPYSGWRNSASSGEAEALDYVQEQLGQFATLADSGLDLERQSFKVFLSTELWDTRLDLTVNDQEIEVPADALRGSRYVPMLARNLDSDGVLNDSEHDPLVASGESLLVRQADHLFDLGAEDVEGRVLFLDFTLLDAYATPENMEYGQRLTQLIDEGLAGLVLVTEYSNIKGESHGTVVGDGSIFQYLDFESHIPILYARLEDLEPAGIHGWEDLEQVESARLTWDVDVFWPGQSGNLIARIPGEDSSQAVILGAHIDSPNGPGAFDDGSGSAALLEIARVLDESQVKPVVDVYLVWFGGHEIGVYGSAYFVSTHQDLLDRTLAMLQVDCLGRPLDGNSSDIALGMTSYGRFGDDSRPLPDFLVDTVASQNITPEPYVEYGLISDNGSFTAFNVPNSDVIYLNIQELQTKGGGYIHYSGHLHDPYETTELAREVGDVLVDMTKIALAAALETGRSQPELRVAPEPDRRALVIATHTESGSFAPSMLMELGMALAWEGFDVDLLPYGQRITQGDLEDVGVVVLLPTLVYPGQPKMEWSEEELDMLDSYVAEGGFMVVVNTGYDLAMTRHLDYRNAAARDLNLLLEPMGITYQYGTLGGDIVLSSSDHPLMAGAGYMTLYENNGVPFSMASGIELAHSDGRLAIGLVDYGDSGGQVLVLADIGLFKVPGPAAKNQEFLRNIAAYSRFR